MKKVPFGVLVLVMMIASSAPALAWDNDCEDWWYCEDYGDDVWDDYYGGGGGGGAIASCPQLTPVCSGDLECQPVTSIVGVLTKENYPYDGFGASKYVCGTKSCWLIFRCECGLPTTTGDICN